MAAPSIAALYRNSDEPSSAKKRQYTYEEMLSIVEFSGAPHSIRQGTISALKARGPWPREDGPAHGVICVSLIGMQFHGVCCRSTARWRARRAVRLGYWRQLREANSWSNCRKCGAERESGKCEKCGYVGRSKTPEGKANFDEFCRPYMYEIDIEKFRSAPRCKELRQFDARTYAEHKAAAKRGEHPNVTEMPSRKPAQPTPPDPPPAPAKQPAAEHAHRNTVRPEPKPQPKLTKRECAKFVADMAVLMSGCTQHVEKLSGYGYDLDPSDPRYRPKLSFRQALAEVAKVWKREQDAVVEALKFWGYQLQE
jgi:hypothetical protein